MKILVTGATGFVGSHLCDLLVEKGHQVISLARNEEKFKRIGVKGHFLKGNLSSESNMDWISRLPTDLDAVIHTAGIVHSFDNDVFYETNFRATQKLVNDLKVKYSKLTFVHLSSLAASGPQMGATLPSEDHECHPVSHYGQSKLLSEKKLNEIAPKDWNVIVFRPPMVIGPRDTAVLDIFKMVKSKVILLTGKNARIKQYSFICVFDLVNIIYKSLNIKTNKNSNVYFASYPEIISYEKLINEIARQMKVSKLTYIPVPDFILKGASKVLNVLYKIYKHDIPLTPDKYHEISAMKWTCNSKKSMVDFDYKYNWDLEQTISTTLKDYQNRNWL